MWPEAVHAVGALARVDAGGVLCQRVLHTMRAL